jgi:hypothetical protein
VIDGALVVAGKASAAGVLGDAVLVSTVSCSHGVVVSERCIDLAMTTACATSGQFRCFGRRVAVVTLPNGSRICFARPTDGFRLLGHEFSWGFFEDCEPPADILSRIRVQPA